MNPLVKKILPHIWAIAGLLFISLLLNYPVLESKRIVQHDIMQYQGMASEANNYRNIEEDQILWTRTMFGGMPSFQISVPFESNMYRWISEGLAYGIPHPAGLFFKLLLCAYIAGIVLGLSAWSAFLGALLYGLASYNFIIIEAGHNTKALALAYVLPALAGLYITLKGNWKLGGIISTLFIGLNLYANHLQITYYMMLAALIIGLWVMVQELKAGRSASFFKGAAVLLLAALLAGGTGIGRLWTTYEYGKETMRGGSSELERYKKEGSSGLEIDYAYRWSQGIAETFTLAIPNFYGGASTGKLSEDSETHLALISNGVDRARTQQFLKNVPLYFGAQPFTSGPVYVGIIALFLALLSLFGPTRKEAWPWMAVTGVAVVMAWGSNFMWVNEFLFYNLPFYNKFRAPSMSLVLVQVAVFFMVALVLRQIEAGQNPFKYIPKGLRIWGIFLGFIAVLGFVGSWLMSFDAAADEQFKDAPWLVDALKADRASLLRIDTLRTLFFLTMAGVILYLEVLGKLKLRQTIPFLAALVLLDQALVGTRYLSGEDFVKPKAYDREFLPDDAFRRVMETEMALEPERAKRAEQALERIRKEEGKLTAVQETQIVYWALNSVDPFRVFNARRSNSAFNDANTSYFFHSTGGYHAAKLVRYQDLIDRQLSQGGMNAFNMLNTKYIFTDEAEGQPGIQQNPGAMGNLWNVDSLFWVATPDQEIDTLDHIDLYTYAVVDERHKAYFQGFNVGRDSLAEGRMTKYHPDTLTYTIKGSKENLWVFSEIWYDPQKGMHCYLDGEQVDYIRVNYLLRGVRVPAGEHQVQFIFEPRSYYTGRALDRSFSMASVLFIALLAFSSLRRIRPDA